MKKLYTILVLFFTLHTQAQKTIQFNGKTIDVEGALVATHQFVNDGKDDGAKEIYSNQDADLNILTITEINTDKYKILSSVFIYFVNLNQLNKPFCYVTEKTNSIYRQPAVFVATLGLQPGFEVNIKSMNWGDADWTKTKETIAQVYFTSKADAEKYIDAIKK